MWIISSDGNRAVDSSQISKIEATTKGKVVACTKANGTLSQDIYLGAYENEAQAGIAMMELLDALEDNYVKAHHQWSMPQGNEPYMQVEGRPRGGAFEARGKKTTGKTK